MQTPSISYKRHQFPPSIIAHAVWLYVRFNLCLREAEKMLLERGIDVSYETVRRWTTKFGPQIARNLRKHQFRHGDIWHLDEVVVKISGKTFRLWRAVDQYGVVLDDILQSRRDKPAAKRLLRKLLKRMGSIPKRIITDKLRSYGAAKRELVPGLDHWSHEGLKSRAENSHLPFRKQERVMQGHSYPGDLQRFVPIHSAVLLRSSSPTRRPDHSIPPDGSSPRVESSSLHRLRPSSTALTAAPSVNVTIPNAELLWQRSWRTRRDAGLQSSAGKAPWPSKQRLHK